MRLVLDSGAFIALQRGDRYLWALLKAAEHAAEPPITHGGIVGQVWRGRGPKNALLARAFSSVSIRALDAPLGRAAGELLARAGARDVIDAALVLIAREGDRILTSDPNDLAALAAALGHHVEVVGV